MTVGKRTQAYFIGFLLGVVIVSILIDSRRERMAKADEHVFTWNRQRASLENLPSSVVIQTKATGYVTSVEQVTSDGQSTGMIGYFFANEQGQRYWLCGAHDQLKLYSAEVLSVVSRPGLEPDLMKSGFEHQGHEVISDLGEAPRYQVGINVYSAVELVDAYENLLSKKNYIASVDWVAVDSN